MLKNYNVFEVTHLMANTLALNWQKGFQDPATPMMHGILLFNTQIMCLLVGVAYLVSWLLLKTLIFYRKGNKLHLFLFSDYGLLHYHKNNCHYPILEGRWTVLPAYSLFIISYPSFTLLYSMEDKVDPSITLKVIGHQWYWSYEYSDYIEYYAKLFRKKIRAVKAIKFDSYLVPTEELSSPYSKKFNFSGKLLRLLEVDNRVVLPIGIHIRALITSADVLHSWAIPSLGIKVDSCPGRLNQVFIFLKRPGIFYGQCSEICGVNHGFMPIVVQAVPEPAYQFWIGSKGLLSAGGDSIPAHWKSLLDLVSDYEKNLFYF